VQKVGHTVVQCSLSKCIAKQMFWVWIWKWLL